MSGGGRMSSVKPHPRIRKAVKWGATLVAAALAITWIGSVWTRTSWGTAHKDRLVVQHGQCTLRGGEIAGVTEVREMVTDGWSGYRADAERDLRLKRTLDQYRFRLNVQRTTPDVAVGFAWTRIPPPTPFLTRGGGYRSPWLLTIPLWVAVAPATVLAAFMWRFDRRATRRALGNVCTRCGYDRRGLAAAAVCPECGGVPSNDSPLTPALTPPLPAPSHPHPPT